MTKLIILLLCFCSFDWSLKAQEFGLRDRVFKGQNASTIDWDKIEHENWLNLNSWKVSMRNKSKDADWLIRKRELEFRELVGRIISCVGSCSIYRGRGFNQAKFRSELREKDDLVTDADSYAWVFFLDGSVLRLSPKSSISLKEINIAEEEIFLHFRLNEGHAIYMARDHFQYKKQSLTETDRIFLPLHLVQANSEYHVPEKQQIGESYLDDNTTTVLQYEKLNQLIQENNKIVQNKPTYSFVVFGNGSLYGKNIKFEAFTSMGHETHVRLFSDKEKLENVPESYKISSQFYFRGYTAHQAQALKSDQWYQISPSGREIEENNKLKKIYSLTSILTKRIPTILIAREMMFKKYSTYLYSKNLDEVTFAKNYGHRLWSGPIEVKKGGIKSEQAQRLEFLLEYTRRTETTLLSSSRSLRARMRNNKDSRLVQQFNLSYYGKALSSYLSYLANRTDQVVDIDEYLNKIKRRYWIIKNAKGL